MVKKIKNKLNTAASSAQSKCGFCALVGRPNVGKSTLLNHLLKHKVSITSRKAQTTRHRLLGVDSSANSQAIYVDTPGLHLRKDSALNNYMNRTALNVLPEVDVVLWLVDRDRNNPEDDYVANNLCRVKVPIILVINKIDLMENKANLLPLIDKTVKHWNKQGLTFSEIIPVSALRQVQLVELRQKIFSLLPLGPFLFDANQLTDKHPSFLISEIVREKIIRQLGDELPYATTVVVEKQELKKEITLIAAVIYCERDSQKAILIGKGGSRIKSIGSAARIDLEKSLKQRINLQLVVRVSSKWSRSESKLRNFGYN